jgi:hypothetical protein
VCATSVPVPCSPTRSSEPADRASVSSACNSKAHRVLVTLTLAFDYTNLLSKPSGTGPDKERDTGKRWG